MYFNISLYIYTYRVKYVCIHIYIYIYTPGTLSCPFFWFEFRPCFDGAPTFKNRSVEIWVLGKNITSKTSSRNMKNWAIASFQLAFFLSLVVNKLNEGAPQLDIWLQRPAFDPSTDQPWNALQSHNIVFIWIRATKPKNPSGYMYMK